jgi:hypothetical protein
MKDQGGKEEEISKHQLQAKCFFGKKVKKKR